VVAFATPIAHLTLQSQPGDFIGQGGTFDLLYESPSDAIFAQIGASNGIPGSLFFIVDSPAPGNQFATLTFTTFQLGIPVQPGTYLNAERGIFATPGHPGLDVTFQNRGSNSVTGSFTIFDVTYVSAPNGELRIATFDAQFEQHSEGAVPALFGSFEYDASGTPVPEPATMLLCMTGAVLLYRKQRRIFCRSHNLLD